MTESTAVVTRDYVGEIPIDSERMKRFSMHDLLMMNPDGFRAQYWQFVLSNEDGMDMRDLIVITFRNNIADARWMKNIVNDGEMDRPIMAAQDAEIFCMYTRHEPEVTDCNDPEE